LRNRHCHAKRIILCTAAGVAAGFRHALVQQALC
jgi:hypothetical protein